MDRKIGIYSRPGTGIPPDDLRRSLTLAQPEKSGSLPHLGIAGGTYTVLLTGENTSGQFSLIEMLVPPGGGPPPHRHDFEEAFVLLQGELEFTFRGNKSVVHAGETINVPSNAPHQFHNISQHFARMLCLCSPAGQENFFMEVGVPLATRETAAPKLKSEEQGRMAEKVKELAPRFRTEILKAA